MQKGKFKRKLKSEWIKFRARHIDRGALHRLSDTVVLELTNRCTLTCSCCPNGKDASGCRPRHTMTTDEFETLWSNMDVPVRSVFLHLHGEPFLNKDLPEIARRLQERGVRKFTIFSNGYGIDTGVLESLLRLTGKGEWSIAFSGEMYSKGAYEEIRTPGGYERILSNMKVIDGLMSRYGMGYAINAIIDSATIGEARANVRKLFGELTQLTEIKFSSRFPWPHLPETGDLAGHLVSRRPICSQVWDMPVIMSDGRVSLCSSDYRGECVVGSLHDHRYSELMNNGQSRAFRLNLLNRHPEKNPLCADCLIDRYQGFMRGMRRKFAMTASEEHLDRYFDSFKRYFV